MTARFFIVKESQRKGKDKNNSEIMKLKLEILNWICGFRYIYDR